MGTKNLYENGPNPFLFLFFLLKRRESTLAARSEVLERQKKSVGDACIPELTTRRHRGRSQAPWTVVMLRQPS